MKYLSAICRPRVGLAEVKYLGAICRPGIGGSREGPTCTFQATDDCPNCTALQNQLFRTAKKPDTECCQSQREWMSWPDTLEGGQLCALCWEATRVTCTAKRVVFLSYKDAKAIYVECHCNVLLGKLTREVVLEKYWTKYCRVCTVCRSTLHYTFLIIFTL